MNASGLMDCHQHWLLLSQGDNVVRRWRNAYLPVYNQMLIGQIWWRSGRLAEVELVDVYRLAAWLPSVVSTVARWTPEAGVTFWDKRNIFQRRSDWGGLTLHVVALNEPPLTVFNPSMPRIEGYFGDVWRLLADALNFNYTLRASVDGQFGVLQTDGSWSGGVGMLHRREVDVAVGQLSITHARSQVIDFSSGLFPVRYRLHMKKPSHYDLNWSTYLEPFDAALWGALCTCLVITSGATSAMYWIERSSRQRRRHDGNFGVMDSVLYVFGAACQQGADATPGGLGTRLLFWTVFLTMTVVSAAYSAVLISFLAVRTPVLPFSDLHGFLEDGTYKLTVVTGNAEYDYFKYSKFDLQRRVFNYIEPVQSHEEALRRIHSEQLVHLMSSTATSCDVVLSEESYYDHQTALGLQKNSPYLAFFNYHIARFKESGLIRHAISARVEQHETCETERLEGLGLPSVVAAPAVIAAGVAASLLVLAAEVAYFRLERRLRPRSWPYPLTDGGAGTTYSKATN